MQLRLELERIAHGGEAIGFHQGKVVFVSRAIPGEEILAEVVEEKERYLRASPLSVLKSSPERVEPRCPHFGACGGCQWQHISYKHQLRLKEEVLRGQLVYLGRLSDVEILPSVGAEEPWFYRNHVQLWPHSSGGLGFMSARGDEVVPIETCYIAHSLIMNTLRDLDLNLPGLKCLSIRAGTKTGQQLVILEMAPGIVPVVEVDEPLSCVQVLEDETVITLVGDSYITEEVGGRAFRISPGSFFQVNTPQTERLLEVIRECVAPKGDEIVLDAYCGVGTFGLLLAPAVKEVVGVEENRSALQDAKFNAQTLANVRFIAAKVENALPQFRRVDVAIVDPPRRGCTADALQALLRLGPPRLVYVSCDPATMARDMKMLSTRYRVLRVQPIDMFPQTYHLEAVALLEAMP